MIMKEEQKQRIKQKLIDAASKRAESNLVFIVMFKISGGKKDLEFLFAAMSDAHAVVVANDFYEMYGLIGRYYCETSTGKSFSVS